MQDLYEYQQLQERRVESEYAGALAQYPWDLFMTVTFRRPRKDWEKVLRVGRDLHYAFHAVRSVFSAEPFHQSAGFHLHVLSYYGDGSIIKPTLEEVGKFANRKFGISKVESVYSSGITGYVSKFSAAQGMCELLGEEGSWELPDPKLN